MNTPKIDILDVNVPSTNIYAMQHDLPHGTVVLSPSQSGGKGRNGRSFVSHIGGAYFSIVRQDDFPLSQCTRYALAAPLAVVDAVRALGVLAAIKWPNDVLVDGAKLAGILIETKWSSGKVLKAVVGIGINVNNDISDVPCLATSLSLLTGQRVPIPPLVEQVARRLDAYLTWDTAHLAASVKSVLYTLGKRVLLPSGHEGVACDMTPEGNLVVAVDDHVEIVTAGDVVIKEDIC